MMTGKILAGLAILSLALSTGLALHSTPARAADSKTELQSVLDELETIVTQLALNDTLNSAETDSLRKKLANIYHDLENVKAGLPSGSGNSGGNNNGNNGNNNGNNNGGSAQSGNWKNYADATLDMTPAKATFSRWESGYTIQSGFTNEAGVLSVMIDNIKYKASWTIRNAYSGNVKTSTAADKSGDVTITINDDYGQHKFLIRNGGTGPILINNNSGGDKATVPIQTAPGNNNSSSPQSFGDPIPGKWYAGYRGLVAAKQLDQSEAMEWFIDQADRYDYVNDALRDLGQACKALEGKKGVDHIGSLRYYSAGQPKKIVIPDPRVSAANFVMIINKAYILQNAGEWYKVDID